MKILIIGSGLMGLSSALFLAKSGHKVTVLDEKNTFGQGASFANGAQISASYSQPWASLDNLKSIISYLGQEQSPILFKPKFDRHQTCWSLDFLRQCWPSNNEKNIRKMLNLSLYSRQTFEEIEKEFNFDYSKKFNGILTFYSSQSAFEKAKTAADIMRKYGLNREVLSREKTIELEPVLGNNGFQLYGSDYTKGDYSGDAYLWMENVYKICKNDLNVEFLFNTKVLDFIQNKSGVISNIVISENNQDSKFLSGFDIIVLAAGSYSYEIAKRLEIDLGIYPVKGYSATMKVKEGAGKINEISLTDSVNKIVFSNLNGKLRIAGTAEFNGFNTQLNDKRTKFLSDKAKEYFGDIFEEDVFYWTGLRPTTTTGMPYIGESKVSNFYLNCGHGTLGWTMAAGSGRILSQVINKKEIYGNYLW